MTTLDRLLLPERLRAAAEMLRERGKKEQKNLLSLGVAIKVMEDAAVEIDRFYENLPPAPPPRGPSKPPVPPHDRPVRGASR